MTYDKPIGTLFNKRPDIRTFAHDSRLPIPDKYIGIEIEAENIKYRNEDLSGLLNYWDVVADGSLRNYGTEFVSSMLRGTDITAALVELNNIFAAHKISPEFSARTSVHIHVDGRFSTGSHLRVLVLHYLMWEPFLFSYLGKDRENNPYCVPFYKNNRGIRNLSTLFKDNFKFEHIKSTVYDSSKYEAMNLRSLYEKGSIEFRLHYGTSSTEEIFNWVQVILTLFKIAKETSEDQFFQSFYSMKYEDYISEIRDLFIRKPEIDLARCEYLANSSVTKLLLYAKATRSASKECDRHWGRGVAVTPDVEHTEVSPDDDDNPEEEV